MNLLKNPLIVALDVDRAEEAVALADALVSHVGAFKIGMQLYNSVGPAVVQMLKAKAAPLFIDLKLHDIPNTVAAAARVLTRHGAQIINVHAAGGMAMMQAAADAVRDEAAKCGVAPPLVVAVTLLTSIDEQVFHQQMGFTGAMEDRVVAWAVMAKESGLDGVVASPKEVAPIRAACGEDFVIITPGVRPADAALNDQKRVATPAEAIAQGATYLVIGRPITGAGDPVAAAGGILREIGWK